MMICKLIENIICSYKALSQVRRGLDESIFSATEIKVFQIDLKR